jgi:hypothetical protein
LEPIDKKSKEELIITLFIINLWNMTLKCVIYFKIPPTVIIFKISFKTTPFSIIYEQVKNWDQ